MSTKTTTGAALLAMAAFLFPASADAATFEICVRVNIQTTDSDLQANGVREDYYRGMNTRGTVIGRGFRVRVSQGSWSRTFDASPNTGCFSFTRNSSRGFGVRVYGFATDARGNHVRIRTGSDTTNWYPGSTYSRYYSNQTLSSSRTNVFTPGSGDDRWTTMAAAAFGLWRNPWGPRDSTISIRFDDGDCNDSGSTRGSSEMHIESRNAHLFQIGRCTGTASDAREKMMVTHELGHAFLRLYYGFDGDDRPRSQTYQPPSRTPRACVNVDSYGMDSLEWNSQTFKEAYADFFSARVWNRRESQATYVYRGVAYDLERWDRTGGRNNAGGVTTNVCSSTASNVSTKGDWLRYLWDVYTAACSTQPSSYHMYDLYRAVRENHRTGTYRLSNTNYDDAVENALDNSLSHFPSCAARLAVSNYGPHNNI